MNWVAVMIAVVIGVALVIIGVQGTQDQVFAAITGKARTPASKKPVNANIGSGPIGIVGADPGLVGQAAQAQPSPSQAGIVMTGPVYSA